MCLIKLIVFSLLWKILLGFTGATMWFSKWMQQLIEHEALFVCDLFGKVSD